LKVLAAEFVTSAALRPFAPEDPERRSAQGRLPAMHGVPQDGLPHIALVGRSNVGKSSLINALCRRKIAHTSAAPGKTRLANIYRVTIEGPRRRDLYFVDLPGYGYARGGADAADELRSVAEGYFSYAERGHATESDAGLTSRATARATLLLIDARHPGLESDVSAHEWLTAIGVDTHIVATKIDKLSRSERARNLKALGDRFGRAALPVSAQSGEGLNELWQLIIRLAKSR